MSTLEQRRRFIRPHGEAVVGMIRTKRKIIRVSPTSHLYGAISAGQDFSSSTATFLEFGATGFLQFIGFPLRLNILDRDIEIVFFLFPPFSILSPDLFFLPFSYFRSCLFHSLHQLATFKCKR